MKAILIFLLGLKLTDAVTHSYSYIYTGTSGIEGFPEFVVIGMVDGQQVSYFDTDSMKLVPRTDWVSGAVDADFWDRNGRNFIATHPVFKNNIEVAKQRFNQTGGVHSFQNMYGCELDDDGTTRGYWQYGYDGEDLLSLDKSSLTWTAANPQAVITKKKWDADNALNQYTKSYLESECIEWLQKYVGYGRSTLERKDAPEVFLFQKDSSSPVSCQATGFFPRNIMMSWKKNGEEHHEDVDVGTTLPNADGSFQKTITLSVQEWKKNKEDFRCVVQHGAAQTDITVTVRDIRSNTGSDNTLAIIVGCVVGCVALLAVVAGLIVWKKKNGYGKASTSDSDSDHSDQALEKVNGS